MLVLDILHSTYVAFARIVASINDEIVPSLSENPVEFKVVDFVVW